MTAIIDNIKLRKVVNKVLSAPERDIIEKITDQDIYQNSSGYFAILNECIYNDTATNFKGLFTDEACSTPYSSDAYTLNVTSAVIQFTSYPPTLYAKYLPGGSIIWAEDINHLTDAVKAIDNNALYKDGSIMMIGNLNMGGRNIINSGTINNINLSTHQHLGLDVDGTTQLTEDSISDLSISKITGLQTALDTKQNNLPTQTGQGGKFLTTNGSTMSWGNQYMRNIGELVQSVMPLTDPKLHLLDGSVLDQDSYPELYNMVSSGTSLISYPLGAEIVGNLQNTTNSVWSGFSQTSYINIPVTFSPGTQDWEVQVAYTASHFISTFPDLICSKVLGPLDFHSNVWGKRGSGAPYYNAFQLRIRCLKTDGSYYANTFTSDDFNLSGSVVFRYGYSFANSNLYMQIRDARSSNFTTILSETVPDLLFYTFTPNSSMQLGLGYDTVSPEYTPVPWTGSIDLSGCYIKVGGNIIWQGDTLFRKRVGSYILDEDLWQTNNSYFGTCGKFVLDTTNRTVRLPNSVGILEGTNASSELGNINPAGLPNITGSPILGEANSSWSKMPPISGAIYRASTGANKYAGASDSDNDYLAFDASLSNPIYGRSNTVQPQTTKVLHYMVVSK